MLNCLGSISCEPIRAEQGGMEAQHFFQHPKISPMAGYSAKYRLNNQPFRFLFLLLFPPFYSIFFLFSLFFSFSKKKKERNGNKEMSEKRNFLFLFSFPFSPNFLFLLYNKYDSNFVLLIFRKKEEKAGKKEKISPRRTD